MALTLHGTVSDNTAVLDRRSAKPLIINGDMAVDQRNSGASVTAVNNAYQVDRWRTFSGAASKFTVQQQTSVVPPFFKNAQKITSSSAYSAAAGEAFALNTPIEGGSIANLGFGTANAKYVTLSFLVYSSLTGTFSGSLFNSAWNRSYPFTYSVSSANTWTTIVVAIPGDTSGTWLTTTGTGLVVNFDIGSGSNWKGSANAWGSAAYTGVAGSVSIVGTSGATFYVTGVQLEMGQFDANSIAPFQHESFGDSLMRCERYCKAITKEANYAPVMLAHGVTADVCRGAYFFQTPMRAAPSFTHTGNIIRSFDTATAASSATAVSSRFSHSIDWTASGLFAANEGILMTFNTTAASLIYSAEL